MANIRDIKYGSIVVNEFDYGNLPVNEIDYADKTVFLNDSGPHPGFGEIVVSNTEPRTEFLNFKISAGTYPNSLNPGSTITIQSSEFTSDSSTTHVVVESEVEYTRMDMHYIFHDTDSVAIGFVPEGAALASLVEKMGLTGVVKWAIKIGSVPAVIWGGPPDIPVYGATIRKDILVAVEEGYVVNETADLISTVAETITITPSSGRPKIENTWGFPVIASDGSKLMTSAPPSSNSGISYKYEEYIPEVTDVSVTVKHYSYYLLNGAVPTPSTLSSAVAANAAKGEVTRLDSQLKASIGGPYKEFDEYFTTQGTVKVKRGTTDLGSVPNDSFTIGGMQNYTDVVTTFNTYPELTTEEILEQAKNQDVYITVSRTRSQPTGYAEKNSHDQAYYVDAPVFGKGAIYRNPRTSSVNIVAYYTVSKDGVCVQIQFAAEGTVFPVDDYHFFSPVLAKVYVGFYDLVDIS